MKPGFDIKADADEIKLQRTTKETKVNIVLNQIKNKKLNVKTKNPFLDHMVETLTSHANLNIGVHIVSEINLGHTNAEDIGIALGRAILELYKSKIPKGVEGFGYAHGLLDEAFADAAISIEGRVNYFIDGPEFKNIDGTSEYDLISFLEGFSQGCRCTLRINYSGKNPHHSWEAAFRALGHAIRKTLQPNSWKKGTTSGMKGTLE